MFKLFSLFGVLALLLVVALDLPSAAAQNDERTGRIVARLLDDGRVEFGWQPAGGARVLPAKRYFPASIDHQRWLRSSPVEVGGTEIGRINARQAEDGRIEFAFMPTDGERITPQARYFPADARENRWLRSTEITIGPARTGYVAVSAGNAHTCAIRSSGKIVCWGWNEGWDGYVGQSDPPPGTFTAVSAGNLHTCGLRTSGAIECWGDVAAIEDNPPTGSYTAISAGWFNVCGLRENGEVDCTTNDAPAGRFSAVSTGGTGLGRPDRHTCAIRESDSAMECWGNNEVFRITAIYEEEDGTSTGEGEWVYTGQATPPEGSYTAVSAGGYHTCAIRESGEIACWGDNSEGQADAPEGSFIAVSAGASHNCAIRENSGEIACWGANPYPYRSSDAPAGRFIAVSAGGSHTCAIRENGEITCWGSNSVGQATPPPN